MSDSKRYESEPGLDVPVTTCVDSSARVVYALSRSYRNLMACQPRQNYLNWRVSPSKAVFTLCDGSGSPFDGQLAARFLGERLADWLWALPDESQTPQDELKVRLAYQLNAWAQMAQDEVLVQPLPDHLSPSDREDLDQLRRTQGSETVFTCGRIDFLPNGQTRTLFAWAGDFFLRCYTTGGALVQFDPLRNPANRWSSVLGLRGSLSVARLDEAFAVWRVLAYSADLGSLEPELSGFSPRRVQSLMQECFLNRSAADLAVLDLSLAAVPEGEASEEARTEFNENLQEVHLHYLQTSDGTGVFEWTFPKDAVYSLIERRAQDETVLPVYAGAGTHWIVPPSGQDSQYRVCVLSPDGKSWSDWVEPVLVGEDLPPEELVELPPEAEPISPGLSEPVVFEPVELEPEELPDLTLPVNVTPVVDVSELTPFTLSDTQEPEKLPPEKVEQPANELDWDTWQPSYYRSETAVPAAGGAEAQEPQLAAEISSPEAETRPFPAEEAAFQTADERVEPVPQPSIEEAAPGSSSLELAASRLPEAPVPAPAREEALPPPRETRYAEVAPQVSPAQWLNFRSRRGEQPGEYILEWDPVLQVRDYEIKKHYAGRDRSHTVSGSQDLIKGLEPGRHYFRIRPIYPGPRQEWDENNLTVVDVPERIQKAPAGLNIETSPAGTLTLRWTFPPGEYVEEFWVVDVTGKKSELVQRVPGSETICHIQLSAGDERRRYAVRAVNWTAPGPDSRPVTYDPPGAAPQTGAFERLLGLIRSPAVPPAQKIVPTSPQKAEEDAITCSTFYELCERVTAYVKRHGIRMERIRLEQRVGNEENYIPVDSRRTTELVSLNFTKGPDHRLFVFGSKGEVVTAVITFDKTRWTMKVRFSVDLKKA